MQDFPHSLESGVESERSRKFYMYTTWLEWKWSDATKKNVRDPSVQDMHIPPTNRKKQVGDDVQDFPHSLETGVDSEGSRKL